jgi:hypothetical protein
MNLLDLFKSGNRTTEFWIAGVASPIVGLLLILFAVLKVTDPGLQGDLIKFGASLLGTGAVGYAISRGLAKFGHAAAIINANAPGLGTGPAPVDPASPAAPAPAPATDSDAAKTIAGL